MEQEKVWDGVAEKWSEFRDRPVDEVVEFLDGKSGKVLDLGCGSGRNVLRKVIGNRLQAIGKLRFYGVDFSEKLLGLAEGKGYVELKKSGIDGISYGDGFFDWVIFVRVLHCVDSAEKRRKALEEVYRVLKKGGEAVISTIGVKNKRVGGKLGEGVLPWTVDGVKYERYNYVYDKDEFGDLLRGVGFEVVSLVEGKNVVGVVRKG